MWRIDDRNPTTIFNEDKLVGAFVNPDDAKLVVQAVNNMPRNPYLPPCPTDGQHKFSDHPSDIGGNYRCKLCGAYNGSDEAGQPCLGEFKESGKMRAWAAREWDKDLATGNAFMVVEGP